MSWRSGQSYAQELRERVLAAVDEGLPVYEAAPLFRVSVSYIYKALTRRLATGESGVLPRGGGVAPKLAAHEAVIGARMHARPDTTIAQLRAWLLAEHGVQASYGATWATLDRLGLTHKKSSSARPSRTGRTWPRRGRAGESASSG